MAKDKPLTKGEVADAAMRAANIVDAGLQGTLGYARLAARLQSGMKKGATAAASQLGTATKSYGKKSAVVGLAIEAGNTAWLAADPDKRARVEAEYDVNAKKSAVERMVEGALNASDTLYATGKSVYDAGKTFESIERSQMDSENNVLLRKIAKHDKQTATAAQDRLGINPQVERSARPQSEAARKIGRLYNNSVTPTNPLSTAYQMDAPLPGLPGAVTRRERSPFARR